MIRAMRPVIIAANWKMNTTPADAGELATTIAGRTREPSVVRVICPPFVCLAAVGAALAGEDVAVGAQDVHHELAERLEIHRSAVQRALERLERLAALDAEPAVPLGTALA